MEQTDGKGDEKFQACISIWEPDVPLAQLDAEYDLQSPYARDHMEGRHVPQNVLVTIIRFQPVNPAIVLQLQLQ